ncbi:hypothetical protein PRIPAC_70240 [Pristionchus pacificus]|uniref:Uncharacterized protein n=1 Tax=Pristionchus pacificus TaxID=54126 RepID=A0A2A6C6H0_PRIPA|nr:hypothetical protein PRIPAC_70240 [Pristionchus pacificus]|eukprot:PDM73653.1 hypothetical protein PRIPAC_41009 [Pristionchus pacificus]
MGGELLRINDSRRDKRDFGRQTEPSIALASSTTRGRIKEQGPKIKDQGSRERTLIFHTQIPSTRVLELWMHEPPVSAISHSLVARGQAEERKGEMAGHGSYRILYYNNLRRGSRPLRPAAGGCAREVRGPAQPRGCGGAGGGGLARRSRWSGDTHTRFLPRQFRGATTTVPSYGFCLLSPRAVVPPVVPTCSQLDEGPAAADDRAAVRKERAVLQ